MWNTVARSEQFTGWWQPGGSPAEVSATSQSSSWHSIAGANQMKFPEASGAW